MAVLSVLSTVSLVLLIMTVIGGVYRFSMLSITLYVLLSKETLRSREHIQVPQPGQRLAAAVH